MSRPKCQKKILTKGQGHFSVKRISFTKGQGQSVKNKVNDVYVVYIKRIDLFFNIVLLCNTSKKCLSWPTFQFVISWKLSFFSSPCCELLWSLDVCCLSSVLYIITKLLCEHCKCHSFDLNLHETLSQYLFQ